MNLIINILAMILAVISVIALLFISAVGGLVYAVLWLVEALAVLTVLVYQWWVRVLTGAKEVGRADTN